MQKQFNEITETGAIRLVSEKGEGRKK